MTEQAQAQESVSSESVDNSASVLTGDSQVEATDSNASVEVNTEESKSFIDSLPAEFKAKAEQKGFKSVEDIINSYNNLESKLGKRFDELTADEIKQLNSKLGAPESADQYDLTVENSVVEDDMKKAFADKVHELGISKGHAENLFKWYNEVQAEQLKELQTNFALQQKEEVESLKKEFGSAFDERIELANKALREVGGEDLIKAIDESGLSSNPALVKMLSEVGKMISEDGLAGSTKDSVSFGMTPAEAGEKIQELFKDSEFMTRYRTPSHPKHKEAFQKVEALFKIKSSGKSS